MYLKRVMRTRLMLNTFKKHIFASVWIMLLGREVSRKGEMSDDAVDL